MNRPAQLSHKTRRGRGKRFFEGNHGELGQFLVEKAFAGGQGRCMGFVET